MSARVSTPAAHRGLNGRRRQAHDGGDRQNERKNPRVVRTIGSSPAEQPGPSQQPAQRTHTRCRSQCREQRAVADVLLRGVAELVGDDVAHLVRWSLRDEGVVDDDPSRRAET